MKWTKDPKAENGLRRLGIEFTVQTVPMHAINRELSMNNQARVGKKINDDWVMEYAVAASQGAEFPMTILDRMKSNCYFIWSGNHRIGAAELCGDKEVPAYIVHVTDLRMQDILPRVVNTWEGHRETKESVLTHAAYICEKHGLDPQEVADMFSLKYEWLSVAIRANDIRKKVADTGVKIELPSTALIRMSSIAGNKNVLKAVVKLYKDYNVAPSGDQAGHILQDVKNKSTEKDQLAEIARWAKLFDTRKEKPKVDRPFKLGRRARLLTLLQNMQKFLDGTTARSQLQLDEADAKVFGTMWDNVETKMNKLLKGD